jgi:elongator complex protein 3
MFDLAERVEAWRRVRSFGDLAPYTEAALAIFAEIQAAEQLDERALGAILRRHPRDGHLFSKNLLVRIYRQLCKEGILEHDEELLRRIRMKPIRTLSGVATVTVLVRPHPCPGRCIFCPTDARMPKSYLPDEPGALRAAQHEFDPHGQVACRIEALHTNGHPVDKIELLILGGTWSSYGRDYQEWFVRRCLDAMNREDSGSLEEAQARNETARHRNVGLVIETRPDHVTPEEVRRLRWLGVTKVQMGAQSLDDAILHLNQRGHDVEATRRAMTLLRAAGFKLVLHWMPNLLGATAVSDLEDFGRLWSDEALRPDEIKIYPCSLLEKAELHDYWRRGDYQPYSDDALVELVAASKAQVPIYCRINRVYRDIPTGNIVAGCKISNLRQLIQHSLRKRGESCQCIRCREVGGGSVSGERVTLNSYSYATRASEERFFSYDTPDGRLAGYARLSLPTCDSGLGMPELRDAAIIREVHVYGQALALGGNGDSAAQHRGLGTGLLSESERAAAASGYRRLAVIASVGTRRYYAARGYSLEGTYMVKEL